MSWHSSRVHFEASKLTGTTPVSGGMHNGAMGKETGASAPSERRLLADVERLDSLLHSTIEERDGAEAIALLDGVRRAAQELRAGRLEGGRGAFARRFAALDLPALERCARAHAQLCHWMNVAEEQHRIRVLRHRDRLGTPPEGSIAAGVLEMKTAGASPDDVRALLDRLFVMPVLTAHPTEARRRTALDHLATISMALDRLDDPRAGDRERREIEGSLAEAVLALYSTEEARAVHPTPLDEIRAALNVFERTLLDATPAIYRGLEEALAFAWPGERFEVGPFLRWGSWVGGDRDGNPNVTAETTRLALERHRQVALARHLADVDALGRLLSASARRVPAGALAELEASLAADRARMPEVAARAGNRALEPFREKLAYMRARLAAAQGRGDESYADALAYLADLRLLQRSLGASHLGALGGGLLRDACRRAEVFGFHLASLDLRQHSAVHEAAVAELLAQGGVPGYLSMGEEARVRLLAELLERAIADVAAPRDRRRFTPGTADLLATLEVVGRARRELGPEACERWVISFTSSVSDVLEVLLLARAARLSPDELRPVPLLEQLEDLARARPLVERLLDFGPVRAALRGDLEVMIGYSDSGKQAGYVPSQVALYRAQEALAAVADERGCRLTVFHGRGGAVGRGGGPGSRAIRAQPPRALRGRLRVTDQGETVTARYARSEIARRDLEQMVSAVLAASIAERDLAAGAERHRRREATMARAADAALGAYQRLLDDRSRLARYAVAATPMQEIAELPIASRPASRRAEAGLAFEELRAIPWVFSWNQSRHGVPGWFGLGTALEVIALNEGPGRARELYETWPFFRALVDNTQLALVRADIEVAAFYAQLAEPGDRALFDLIREEHARTLEQVLRVTGGRELLADHPAILHTIRRRNPVIDVLSHAQIELLRRYREAECGSRERVREILFVTINGIAAGLQSAG